MKILLIDDQANTFMTLEDEFDEKGYELVNCYDATEGLEKAVEFSRNGELAAIIMDIIMATGRGVNDPTGGRESGIVVSNMLREKGVRCPIIFYSVVTDPEIRERASEGTGTRFVR